VSRAVLRNTAALGGLIVNYGGLFLIGWSVYLAVRLAFVEGGPVMGVLAILTFPAATYIAGVYALFHGQFLLPVVLASWNGMLLAIYVVWAVFSWRQRH
jgi:hypothetical protein